MATRRTMARPRSIRAATVIHPGSRSSPGPAAAAADLRRSAARRLDRNRSAAALTARGPEARSSSRASSPSVACRNGGRDRSRDLSSNRAATAASSEVGSGDQYRGQDTVRVPEGEDDGEARKQDCRLPQRERPRPPTTRSSAARLQLLAKLDRQGARDGYGRCRSPLPAGR